uniref:Probable proline--tRNA ligase, mitochondrial n=1 Tax=Clastoptera arizonana TaxID=38151 RepID=A0A1B6DP72_9HEMI
MRLQNLLLSNIKGYNGVIHNVSKLFQPLNITPNEATVKNNDMTSKSQRLMIDNGVIQPINNGLYHLLPLGMRAFDKLINLVDLHMHNVGAQKISLSSLTSAHLWETTGRYITAGAELFNLTDRHQKKYVLSPTHEESITHLIASFQPFSHKRFPLLLYQISTKFRDEMKPRFGLIRAKEFIMKDLYSFDVNIESAQLTYKTLVDAYHHIFSAIGVKYIDVLGDTGLMGGTLSHEFHYPADIGDDILLICAKCGSGKNKEVKMDDLVCQQCKSSDFHEHKGIEVGHTFMLGTRYSEPLKALYSGPEGKAPLVMGSYGLGLTRILAASLEILSLEDQLRWPALLAPYKCIIITPKVSKKVIDIIFKLFKRLSDFLLFFLGG